MRGVDDPDISEYRSTAQNRLRSRSSPYPDARPPPPPPPLRCRYARFALILRAYRKHLDAVENQDERQYNSKYIVLRAIDSFQKGQCVGTAAGRASQQCCSSLSCLPLVAQAAAAKGLNLLQLAPRADGAANAEWSKQRTSGG